MRTKHLAASGVTGFLLVLMAALTAQAGIWCPTPIPGVLMKYCLCRSLTGRAEVSSPSPLPPLKLIGLWRDLNAASMTDWMDQVQAREGKRRFLSHRWALACDRDRDCTVTRTAPQPTATAVTQRPDPARAASDFAEETGGVRSLELLLEVPSTAFK